ncbi:hypothetical protein D9M69_458740 [compost metagenome]
MVALDGGGLLGLGAARFHHVRVDRALRQPLGVGQFLGLGLEYLHELAADDLALLLGVGHTGQVAEELLGSVDVHDLGVQAAGEHLHHHLAFVQAQQAMIDEDAGELVADGAVDQRRGHRRIDAARQAQDHLFVADLFADLGDGFLDVVAHDPVSLAAGDLEHEALEHLAALDGMRDLGVELHGIVAARFVGHAGDRAARGRRHQLEARRQAGDLVAVAHPDLEHAVAFRRAEILDVLEQRGMAVGAHLGVAELALVAPLDLAAKLHGHGLHAVADAQHRHAQVFWGIRWARRGGDAGFLPGFLFLQRAFRLQLLLAYAHPFRRGDLHRGKKQQHHRHGRQPDLAGAFERQLQEHHPGNDQHRAGQVHIAGCACHRYRQLAVERGLPQQHRQAGQRHAQQLPEQCGLRLRQLQRRVQRGERGHQQQDAQQQVHQGIEKQHGSQQHFHWRSSSWAPPMVRLASRQRRRGARPGPDWTPVRPGRRCSHQAWHALVPMIAGNAPPPRRTAGAAAARQSIW